MKRRYTKKLHVEGLRKILAPGISLTASCPASTSPAKYWEDGPYVRRNDPDYPYDQGKTCGLCRRFLRLPTTNSVYQACPCSELTPAIARELTLLALKRYEHTGK